MAGKYGSGSIAITLDDAPGGSSRTITPYVQTIGGIKKESITEESHPFGVTNQSNTPVGITKVPDIEIEGFFDTTATSGPHVVFGTPDDGPQDATRSFTFTPGDSKLFSMECYVVSYEVLGTNGKLTRYKAVIRQAGDGVWS